jgi:hypothetical protein
MRGRDVVIRVGASVPFAACSAGGYWLSRTGGISAKVGWVLLVCFGLATLVAIFGRDYSTVVPRDDEPAPPELESLSDQEIGRLERSQVVRQRSDAMNEVAELLAVSAIRAQMDGTVMEMAGSTPQHVLTLGQSTRGSLAGFLLAEAAKYRDFTPEDAMFLNLVAGDIWEGASTVEIAWRFINFMAAEGGIDSVNVSLAEWVRLFDECGLYNRAAGDSTTSATGISVLTRLVDDFHRPWPAAPTVAGRR